MSTLKPCPFCGSADVHFNVGEIYCDGCDSFFSSWDRAEQDDGLVIYGDKAVAYRWNQRTPTPSETDREETTT